MVSPHLGTTRSLLISILLLSALGLFFVFEASVAESFSLFGDQYYFAKQQLLHFGLGFFAMMVAYFMPSVVWKTVAPWAYVGGLIGLILVFVPGLGMEINGAHRWLFIGGFNFQPIEVMKVAVVFFFASWLTRHQRLAPFLFVTGLPVALVMLQPDLGSTLILLAIAAGLYFVAGGAIKPFLTVGLIGIGLLILLIAISPYRRQRVQTFLNPQSDPLGSSFHVRQLTIALGSGGILGQGIGNSRQKYAYLPEASTDSIFAVVAEEIGLVGSLGVLGVFGMLVVSGFSALIYSQVDIYEKLVGFGALIWITSQVILNLAAAVALVPLTGVPLPFFSYGGTSLVMVLFASGLILHVTRSTSVSAPVKPKQRVKPKSLIRSNK